MAKTAGGIRGGSNASGSLSELAKEAVEYYIDGNGYGVSESLRNNEPLYGEDELLKKGLDEATAKGLSHSYTLYRGISAKSLFGEYAENNYGLFKSAVVNGHKESFVLDAYNKIVSQKKNVYTDAGFMSTSTKKSVAEGFGGSSNVIMKISVPKGTHGIDLNKDRNYKRGENEVLLARGMSFKLGKIYSENGKIYVDATILKKKGGKNG